MYGTTEIININKLIERANQEHDVSSISIKVPINIPFCFNENYVDYKVDIERDSSVYKIKLLIKEKISKTNKP